VRVVIADDSLLVREGIAAVLRRAGIEVTAEAGCAETLLREVDANPPDIAIVDIRMPPAYDDEGLRAAHEIRARHPQIGIVILSSHVDLRTAMRVLAESPERLGYVLKHRLTDADDFVDTLRRVADGESALDPEVVSRLLARATEEGPLRTLTPRERDVVQLVAEGRSNKGIGDRLVVSERAVQKHITSIFAKFGLSAADDDNRRILAVLAYMNR
jgi:DNA-binding NarL/FixJ family response regulator